MRDSLRVGVVAAITLVTGTVSGPRSSAAVTPVLQDATAQYGLTRFTPTFSSAFVDLENDGDDDGAGRRTRSTVAQRFGRIESGGASGRQVAGGDRHQ